MSPGNSKVKVTSHKNGAGVGLCTLVSAGFFKFWTQLTTIHCDCCAYLHFLTYTSAGGQLQMLRRVIGADEIR